MSNRSERGVRFDEFLHKIIRDGEELGVFEDRLGQELVRHAELGIADDFIVSLLRGRVERHRRDVERGRRPPFQEPKL